MIVAEIVGNNRLLTSNQAYKRVETGLKAVVMSECGKKIIYLCSSYEDCISNLFVTLNCNSINFTLFLSSKKVSLQ